eukprot:scaffold299198_cov23-Tisochrysis_lutea.AAC.1
MDKRDKMRGGMCTVKTTTDGLWSSCMHRCPVRKKRAMVPSVHSMGAQRKVALGAKCECTE